MLERAIRLKEDAARARPSGLVRRPADADARLGPLQRSLWLLHRLDPSSAAYHLASGFRVRGEVDLERLERAFRSLVARHRILRSNYRAEGDAVVQVVRPRLEVEIELIEAGADGARAAAVREARRPFDLESGRLVRMLWVEGPRDQEGLLVLVLHHILADERSLARLWHELSSDYEGAEAAPVELQHDDLARWLAGREPDPAALDFWRDYLDPVPEAARLPFESPESGTGPGGRLIVRPLGERTFRAVADQAAALGTTPFSLFAFAFRLLLHRYTEGADLAFGTPVSVRALPETAEMIGYFLNPVVVRGAIDESRAVGSALRVFSEELRGALNHASVPFDVVVDDLRPSRETDHHPFFQSLFVYQQATRPPRLGEALLEPVTLDLGESKFDLTLFVSERPGAPELAVEYRVDRFDEIWMRRLLDHYATIVAHLGDDLQRPVAELGMLSAEDEAMLADAETGPAWDPTSMPLLPDEIRARAAADPEAPALITSDGSWSYRRLERVGRGIARELQRRGVEPGDRVALLLDRTPLMIAGVLGCHWAAAAYVPLDPAYPEERNRAVLEDARVSAVLTRAGLAVGSLEDGAPRIEIDGFAEVEASSKASAAAAEALPECRPELPAYLLYTSGSTGKPKGVVVTHDNLRASNGARSLFYTERPERFLLLPSLAFDSSVAGLFWTLAEGGALVIPSDDEVRDPRRLARLIARAEVTGLLCVPSLYAYLLRAEPERLASLRTVIVAGEACPAQLVGEHFRRLPEVRLYNEYGPTEATVWATVHELRPEESAGPVAIGRPIPGVRIEVLDALGRRVPAGVPGEGWISGPTVAEGYWRSREQTEERFALGGSAGERRFRTGDRLRWSESGCLHFLGRSDDQIKLRGFRIEPGEIESALLEAPQIEEAAVVLGERERLIAFHVGGGRPEPLRELLRSRLPEFMVPADLVELPELPRLPNGKVDRDRLRSLPVRAAPAGGTTARSEVERRLLPIWERLLGSQVDVDDNFFLLGGHSLLVIEMTTAIEREIGVEIAPADVFAHPTVRALGRRLESEASSDSRPYEHLFPIETGGGRPPLLFCIPHFFSEMIADRYRGERPVWGLRGVGLRPEGNRGRWATIRDLGRDLADESERRFGRGRCRVAGYSFGATMAFELARQMEERGIEVECLYLIAPMALDSVKLGPLRFQLEGLRRPIGELSSSEVLTRLVRENHPFGRRLYQRLWRWSAVRTWRRLLCGFGRLRRLVGLPLTSRILHADVRLERFRLHASYEPRPIRTPTMIFNAREPETDAAATWRPYFAGPLSVRETPDPHRGPESVEAAQQVILRHLEDLPEA